MLTKWQTQSNPKIRHEDNTWPPCTLEHKVSLNRGKKIVMNCTRATHLNCHPKKKMRRNTNCCVSFHLRLLLLLIGSPFFSSFISLANIMCVNLVERCSLASPMPPLPPPPTVPLISIVTLCRVCFSCYIRFNGAKFNTKTHNLVFLIRFRNANKRRENGEYTTRDQINIAKMKRKKTIFYSYVTNSD